MDLTGWEKVIAAVGTALAAMLTPIGVMYAASVGRKTKISDTTIASLLEEISSLKSKADEYENEARQERISGMRWYQLVLLWFNFAHDMRRQALDARQCAESMAREADKPKIIWDNDLVLPHIEEPLTPHTPTISAPRSK